MAIALGVAVYPTLYSPPAQAILPTTDYAQFGLKVKSMMADAVAYAKQQALAIQEMDLMAILSQMSIDNVNNGFANMVVRMGGALQDIQNMEQMENSVPAQDACSTITASADLDSAVCSAASQMAERLSKSSGARRMAVGDGTYKCSESGCTFVEGEPPTASDVSRYNAHQAKTIVDKCELLQGPDGSLCDDPSLLVAPPGEHLSVEEYQAAEIQIEISGGVGRPMPKANATLEPDSTQFKVAQAEDMRREGMREKALAIKQHVFMLENGTLQNNVREPGEVTVLDRYLEERIGSKYWICEVTNSCDKSTTNYVAPAELEKRKIQMDAVMMYITLQQYKSSLRLEQLQADMLLLEVEELK